jgi:hypothetical protein
LEANGVVFRHVRSHDQDRIGVREILLCGCCAAAPE